MKNAMVLIMVSLFVASFSCIKCSKESAPEMQPVNAIDIDTVSFERSMKGWELYSWPNGNDWNYSILGGTNRTKSYEEVTNNRIVVFGKDSLKMLLDKIPEGECIFWIGQGWLSQCWGGDFKDLSLPDSKTINEIRAYCNQKNLELVISN
jgi:hypothetical protein